MPTPKLFVSYRRTQIDVVKRAVEALTESGVDCFLDVEDIDPLADFPERVRNAIDDSHAFLVWWSRDYGESGFCLDEFRRAWQQAGRHNADVSRRLWILNPEATADHVFAGELNAKNFLRPPGDAPGQWANQLKQHLEALVPEGPIATERTLTLRPVLRNVPQSTAEFVGRDATLFRIHSKLFPPRIDDAGSDPAVQLHGMGGVGKTEVAARYAQTFAAAYPGGVFWVNMASFTPRSAVDATHVDEAWLSALNVLFSRDPGLQRRLLRDANGRLLPAAYVRSLLGQWLAESGTPYLWVLDNVPPISPLDARDRIIDVWRAPAAGGRTLLTTRDSRPVASFAAEPLDLLGEVDATRLLARYRPIDASDHIHAQSLVRDVGGHSLALTLLGEQLRDGAGYKSTASRLRDAGPSTRLEEIADMLRPELGERARSVISTFQFSIDPLTVEAKRLLALASLCVPMEPIPRALLCEAYDGEEQSDACTIATQALLRSSLLNRRRGPDALEIHPLVADVATRLLDVRLDREGVQLSRALLQRLAGVADVRVHEGVAAYITHARHLVEDDPGSAIAARLLGSVARFDQERGAYTSAERLVRRQAAYYSNTVGPESEPALLAWGDLGRALLGLKKLDEAIALNVRVLKGRRRLLGRDHIDTLTAMNNLATVLSFAARTRQSVTLHGIVLQKRRRILGPEHEHTLFSLNNYGADLLALERPADARPYLEEAYRLRRQLCGPDHENTNASAVNLAHALFDLGDIATAQRLLRDVATARVRTLGDANPKTLFSQVGLGRMMIAQGDAAGARDLLEPTLARAIEHLGPEHPDTLLAMNNLGKALMDVGELERSRSLFATATAGQMRLSGLRNPFTTRYATNLLEVLLRLDVRDEARNVYTTYLAWLTEIDPPRLSAGQRDAVTRIQRLQDSISAIGLTKYLNHSNI